MGHIRFFPGPATELRSPVISERLHDFVARVHDEGAVLHDGFANWLGLQNEDLSPGSACHEIEIAIRVNEMS